MEIKQNEVQQLQVGNRRVYATKDWQYPSITHILDSMPEKQKGLEFWKDHLLKQGHSEEDAQIIMQNKSKLARERGTAVHTLCENYLINQREPFEAVSVEEQMFGLLRPELDKMDITEIDGNLMCEQIVYSHSLQVAGTLDYLAYYDDTLSIIDIKTTEKLKPARQRKAWYLQCAFYSLAVFEMYSVLPEQLIILNPSEEMKLRIYKEDLHAHTQDLIEAIEYYKDNHDRSD